MRMEAAAGRHLDRNGIPAMPTVGAGSSRFSRRFPRPPPHPKCGMPAHPVPRRYSNRGYPWVAWPAYAGGNGIWIAMLSPPMPTVGAGSSRFSRRFPRPPQPPSRRAPLSASRFPSPHRASLSASPPALRLPPHRPSLPYRVCDFCRTSCPLPFFTRKLALPLWRAPMVGD